MSTSNQNRRDFLKTSAAATAAGTFVPYWLSGEKDVAAAPAKSDRLQLGQIGCGGQGNGITGRARRFADVVAVCDVDRKHGENASKRHSGGKAVVLEDYRKLLDRKDIDVVTIGTPDHWHSKIAIEAMQAGKDIYCEKPLTLTIEEGKQIIKVMDETKRVFQVGTQQRSGRGFQTAVAIAQSGRLGKIKKLRVAIGGGPKDGPFKEEKPPANLNWERWLGQTPVVPYIRQRCHGNFRWWLEYSGGKMTDWGAHHVDIAHWAMGADDTGPVLFKGTADFPAGMKDGYPVDKQSYNTATTFSIDCTFAGGTVMTVANRFEDFGNGIMIEGEKGRIFVNRGKLTGKAVDELKENPLPQELFLKIYKGNKPTHHMANFFDCIRTRKEPVSDVRSHHRAMTSCHLANIAIRLGRPIRWDPKTQHITGDKEAASFERREQRKGYEINVKV